jgi:phage-related protein
MEADSIDDLEEKLAAIRTWLNPINGAKQLIFDRTPDYYFNARWSGSGLNADAIGLGGEFSLEMVCSDPFGYALEPQKIIIEETLYEHDQEGNAPANPLLKLYGISTGSPQKISITIGGKTLTFTGPITVSDVIEIDCDAMTCYKITGTTRVNRLYQLETPDFLVLSPGENTISIDEIGGATFTKLEIDCRNRYL